MGVLIADDSPFMRMSLERTLKKYQIPIDAFAEDGLEVVQKYKNLRSQAVIMDITMPNMNGLDAIEHIKAFDPSAKIIVCSAIGAELVVIEAINLGAISYLVKPFSEGELIHELNHILGTNKKTGSETICFRNIDMK